MRIEGKIDTLTLIQKLREGTNFFRTVKWLPPNGLQLSVAASVLAGLLFAVKDGKLGNFVTASQQYLSDEFASSDKLWLVPGLQNLGNNCFLNVILQVQPVSALGFSSLFYPSFTTSSTLWLLFKSDSFFIPYIAEIRTSFLV